jgi:hypothetical protein
MTTARERQLVTFGTMCLVLGTRIMNVTAQLYNITVLHPTVGRYLIRHHFRRLIVPA